ncbi:MAG: methyltransferase domain-containing protein [Fuerstiella sp.]|nr:methyltransferase domain-containing protein [Fuerstiella sp.]
MQPQRLTFHFRLFLLVSVTLLSVTANAQELNERFPNELNSDIEEPRIALPEVQRKSRFRTVSRSRQKSNDALIELCKESVDTTARRLLSTESHTPWQIMHGLLALRRDFQIEHEDQSISGLDWVSEGQVFDGEYWFESSRHGGRAHPYSRPYAFEGHANQFLAILSMCGVELDRTFGTSSGPVTMRGMINNAQKTVGETDEPTWTLWALSRYLPSSARWRNEEGESWSIEKLVQNQTAKPMQGAPCGGTHGLFALAHARNVYLRQRKPLRGVWLQAEYKIRKYINTARMQQNADGTLSSNFFRGKEYAPDFNKRMASAGHILEFLMIALPQNELGERWVRRAIEATARDLLDNRKAYVKCSPLYHSVNALNIYLDRVNPMVPADRIASGRKKDRTAKLTPHSSGANDPPLKSVPVTRITKSRKLPEEQSSDSVPAKEVTEEAAPTTPVATPSVPLREVPEMIKPEATGEQGKTAAEPTAVITENDPTKWKATPPDRRTPISEDASEDNDKADAKDEESPAPPSQDQPTEGGDSEDPPMEDGDDANTGHDDGRGEPKAQTDENEPQSEDLTESPEPIQSVSKSRVMESDVEVLVDTTAPNADAETESITIPDDVSESDALAVDADEITEALSPIVKAIGLSEGMSVADVGSGTGLFLNLLSEQVGSEGRVFAIDASPRLVRFLEERVVADELTNVDVVSNDDNSLALVNKRVDRILVCDAYRAFENPSAMLFSIKKNLQADGELIVVESVQSDDLVAADDDGTDGQTSRESIQATIEAAGFEYVEEVTIPDLGSGFFLRFRRTAE